MTDATAAVLERQRRYELQSPNPALKYLEPRALLEALALVPAAPFLLAQSRGDGRQVMLLPGFMADERTMWPLQRYLNYLGYDALPWGLGRNNGQPEQDAGRVVEQLNQVRRADEPITLIGWSLGGVIAREVARREPDKVREVITLGTPVEGGPKYTATSKQFEENKHLDLDTLEQHIHEVNSKGIDCPLTIVYSRGDGIVDWRAAIDRYNPQARHRRIAGSHLGMAVNPVVWRVIARTLAGNSARASD
ncbi:MAG: alpha/beta fold hydrolase [Woeseiaceae bacterium]|nr:alpha/beta fold hydrolase [Woeseiaceae bacterium]